MNELGPTVRLALSGNFDRMKSGLGPHVRLAEVPGTPGTNVLTGTRGVQALPESSAPGILVSYYYLKQFLAKRSQYVIRDWVLDSGAFSAKNSGVDIDLAQFIKTAKVLLETDEQLTEVFALDVIGDPQASMRNCETMNAQGVPAIPCFHFGSSWSYLTDMAKRYSKIALGGVVGLSVKRKNAWAAQCFARVWPKKIHGFGFGSERSVMALPFHSVDATNWEAGPSRFGSWKSFGKMSVRGSTQNLRAEVEWYLKLEQRARARWAREMQKLEDL